MSSLFDPDPELPFWLAHIPTDEELEQASLEKREQWLRQNAAIAYVHTAWSNLETHLAFLLSAVLRIKVAEAQVILGSLTANRPKRDLIQNCTTLSLASPKKAKMVERVLRRTAKAASKRNFIAHGTAMYHQRYPDKVTVTGVSATLEPALSHYVAYSEQELLTLRNTINAISVDIYDMLPSIWRARRRALPQTPLRKLGDDPAFAGNPRRSPDGER